MTQPVAPARILVIDDESQIRRFLRISLKSQGHEVFEAATGADGLSLAATQSPDLIVLDLGLPDADGKAVLSELRAWSQVPVIVLTVRDAEREKVQALDGGANDYVTKPFGVQELLARVRSLLRQRRGLAGTTGSFEDAHLSINLGRRLVTRDGITVHLTPKEYAVLQALVSHPGRVVTQTQLLRELWGPTHVEDTHYLRIVIGKLRQKLGDDSDEPRYLQTEPGVGYRFIGDQANQSD